MAGTNQFPQQHRPVADLCNHTTNAPSTLHPGHDAILEMHANSHSNAITYVVVVLLLYAIALVIVLVKYLRNERYEARLSRLYDEFMRRDRFPRMSKRNSVPTGNTPAPSTDTIDEDCPRSPGPTRLTRNDEMDSCL